ncbi:MAG: ABC transporter substrate-binding protein, partial [Draconibacterium sp.]|nr:ABC transporter substrate-binding protein [Draconibacterium sp.]
MDKRKYHLNKSFWLKTGKSLFVILTAFMLFACDNDPVEQKEIKIGTHRWIGYEPLFLAKSLGHLDERIKFIEFASATNIMTALKNGKLDGATLTLDEALVMQQQGIELLVVLVNDFSYGADSILLSPRYSKQQSLKGLKIGLEGGGVNAYILSRALEQHGLQYDDVTIVQVKPSEQLAPLQEGLIDGVVTFEPFRSELLKKGAIEIFNSTQIPGEIIDVTVLRKSAINSDDDLFKNLQHSWFETVDFMRSEPEVAFKRIAERKSFTVENFSKGINLIHIPDQKEVSQMMGSQEG